MGHELVLSRVRTVVDDCEVRRGHRLAGCSAARGAGSCTATARRPPDPTQTDPNVPFDVHDPPQGKFAVVDRRERSRNARPLPRPQAGWSVQAPRNRLLRRVASLQHPEPSPTTCAPSRMRRFRIDLVRPSAPMDSRSKRQTCWSTSSRPSPADFPGLPPADLTEDVLTMIGPDGATPRLAVTATTEDRYAVGINSIFFAPVGPDGNGRIELSTRPEPSRRRLDLVLHRLTRGGPLAALLGSYREDLPCRRVLRHCSRGTSRGRIARRTTWAMPTGHTDAPDTPDTKLPNRAR